MRARSVGVAQPSGLSTGGVTMGMQSLCRAGRATTAGLLASTLLVAQSATGDPAAEASAPCFAPSGEAGRDSLLATMSSDGQFVAYHAMFRNFSGAMVRDLRQGTVCRIDLDANGQPVPPGPDVTIDRPAISADGRFVAFVSRAPLVPGDTNTATDLFIRDRRRSVTVRVDVGSTSQQFGGLLGGSPAVSPDGRFVAFVSAAVDLVPGDTNGVRDVFVRDLPRGTIRRVSISTGGGRADAGSGQPAVSAGARLVAFASAATNLAPLGPGGSLSAVFAHDLTTGRTTRVSPANPATTPYPSSSWAPFISADGRYVAFSIGGSNAVPGICVDRTNVLVADLQLRSYQTASSWCEGS